MITGGKKKKKRHYGDKIQKNPLFIYEKKLQLSKRVNTYKKKKKKEG
jgi:hypothetical protein